MLIIVMPVIILLVVETVASHFKDLCEAKIVDGVFKQFVLDALVYIFMVALVSV